MKRYFDLYKLKETAELTINNGSSAAIASANEFEKYFKTKVNEVNYQEYLKLTNVYTEDGSKMKNEK